MPIPKKAEIYYCRNPYFKGHEQGEHSRNSVLRPYLCVFCGQNHMLGFAMTTKNKQAKNYPSHTNIITPQGEIMLDQLHIIMTQNIGKFTGQLSHNDYSNVINNFANQIIVDKPVHQYSKVSFCDLISLKHNNPILSGYSDYVVVSSNDFHISGMCYIAPIENGNLKFEYLHAIDYREREFSHISEIPYTEKDILDLRTSLTDTLKI